MCAQEKHNIRL